LRRVERAERAPSTGFRRPDGLSPHGRPVHEEKRAEHEAQLLLPATASAVPVLERGKETSLSRKGKLLATVIGFRCCLYQRLLQAEMRHSMTPSLPKVKDAVVRTPKGFRCRLSQRSRHAEMRHSMTSRLPKVKDAVVRTPKGFRCRLSQRLLQAEVRHSMTSRLPKVKDAVVRTPKGFRCRLSQRSRHAEMGHSMTSRLPKVKDDVVRTPKGYRCCLSQRLLQAEVGHSMTSRLPKVKDAVVRTPQGLLPATASAVPVLERGKKTSLSRKGKLICRYFQPNIRTTSKLEAGRACRTSSRYWSRS